MLTYDVIVVGGGVLGASTAYHLARRQAGRVALIEQGSVACGPTGSSSAIIRQNYSNAITAGLARESVEFFQQFAERTGGECGYRRTGCLSLAAEADKDALRMNTAMQQSLGIDVREVSPAEVLDIQPHIALDDVAVVAYEVEAGYADPTLTASGMVDWARTHGVQTWLNTPVRAVTVAGGRVTGIATERESLSAPIVLLATGPWTNNLLGPLGARLPIEVTRHGVYVYGRPERFRGPHAVIGDFPNGVYMRAEGLDLTLVGSLETSSNDAADPDTFAARVTSHEALPYGEKLMQRFPVMADGVARGGWAGVYDVTPDWHPILDAIQEVDGLYVAAGTSGHGFKLSPAIGRLLAGLVTGDGQARTELEPFGRNRFATGREFAGRYSHRIVA